MKIIWFKSFYLVLTALLLSNFLTPANANESADKTQTVFIEMSDLYFQTLKNWSRLQNKHPDLSSEDFYNRFVQSQLLDLENSKGQVQVRVINDKMVFHIFHFQTNSHFLLTREGELSYESKEMKRYLVDSFYKLGESKKNQEFYALQVHDWLDTEDSFLNKEANLINLPKGWKRIWTYLKFRPTFPDKKLSIFRVLSTTGMIFIYGESLRYVGLSGPDLLHSFIGASSLYLSSRLFGPALFQFQQMGSRWERHMKGMIVGLASSAIFTFSLSGGSLASLNPTQLNGFMNALVLSFMNYVNSLSDKSYEKISSLRNTLGKHNKSYSLFKKGGINQTQFENYTATLPGDSSFVLSAFITKGILAQTVPLIGIGASLFNNLFSHWAVYMHAKSANQKVQSLESQLALEKAKKNWIFLIQTKASDYMTAKRLHVMSCEAIFN